MQRKKMLLGLFYIVCITMVLVFLCACSSSSGAAQNNSTPTNNTSNTSNEISINEATLVDGFECRIKEVNWYSASDFDFDVINKEDGFEYIVIVLSEKNTTNDTANAPMISILSADGTQCTNLTALSLYKKQYKINFGATMANSTSEAYTIYQIPAGSNSFKLQILSNGFGSSSEYIVFNRSDIR